MLSSLKLDSRLATKTLALLSRGILGSIVAIVIALFIQKLFLPWNHTPYKWRDYAIEAVSCCIGAAAARFFWRGNRLLVPGALALWFSRLYAAIILSTHPIDNLDRYPFKGYLPLHWGVRLWLACGVMFVVIGSLLGQFVGSALHKRVAPGALLAVGAQKSVN